MTFLIALTFLFLLFAWSSLASLEGIATSYRHGAGQGLFALTELRHASKHLSAGELHDGSEDPRSETEAKSGHVHAESHGGGLEDGTEKATVANHEELEVHFTEEDDPVPEVLEWAHEDVELALSGFVDLISSGILSNFILIGTIKHDGHLVEDTAVDHVEHVHHDENLEQEGLVKQAVGGNFFITNCLPKLSGVQAVWDLEHNWTSIEHQKHNEKLVDGLGQDGSHHGFSDDVFLVVDALLADISWVGVLGGEGNSGKHIHDQVNPEELHHAEW